MQRSRDRQGRWVSTLTVGRKHCTRCRRWRHALDFRVREWCDEGKTRPKYLHSECLICHRRQEKRRWRRMSAEQRERLYECSKLWHAMDRRRRGVKPMSDAEYEARYGCRLDPDVYLPIGPFLEWFTEFRNNHSITDIEIAKIAYPPEKHASILRTMYRWREGSASGVHIDDADRILTLVAGEPGQLYVLYPAS